MPAATKNPMNKAAVVASMLMASAAFSCGPNQRIMESAQENRAVSTSDAETGNAAATVRGFEHDLNAMRIADFNFIYVFRRRDGGVFDLDDKRFITQLTPSEMNRRTLSDEGKAVIIGSNFRLPAENLETFKSRFMFEDYSKPESEILSSNSNANR